MAAFYAKRIGKTKIFKPGIIAIEIREELKKQARPILKSFGKTTENWNGDKPIFGILTQVAPSRSRDVELLVGVSGGTELGVSKWRWLDEGTKERWARMNHRFRRKTQPETTKTTGGHGPFEPYKKGKKQMPEGPAPGIEPRNWSRIITNRHAADVKRGIRHALERGIVKAGF